MLKALLLVESHFKKILVNSDFEQIIFSSEQALFFEIVSRSYYIIQSSMLKALFLVESRF